MLTSAIIFSILTLISGTLFVLYNNSNKLSKIFLKCFTTLCPALFALTAAISNGDIYSYLVFAGLLISVLADGVIEVNLFAGMFTFLMAHIFYIIVFSVNFNSYSLIIFVALMVVILSIIHMLRPAKKLMIGGIMYFTVLSAMVATAIPHAFNLTLSGIFIALGAILFFASDVLLVFQTSRKNNATLGTFVLVLYYLAQLLIALSLYPFETISHF